MGILGGFPENNEFGLGSLGWHEEAADGNCNWFQKEIMVATVGALGAPDTEIVAVRPGGWPGLTAEPHTQAKGQVARKRRILNLGCAAYFNGMTPRALGAVQMPSSRVARVLGPFIFRLARDPGAIVAHYRPQSAPKPR